MARGLPFLGGPFSDPLAQQGNTRLFQLVGTCMSASGVRIASATVYLYDASSQQYTGLWTTSDASGNFLFNPPSNGPYFCRFFKAGSPNSFGTTDVVIPV